MKRYFRFLGTGLVLGLFLEVELKRIAGVNPQGFIVTLFAYPMLVTLFYAWSRMIDKFVISAWRGDILHYVTVGFGGLMLEWIFLGNGPGSNAFQLGMFAMWTTWGFGPRILTRDSLAAGKRHLRFWRAFTIVAIVLTVTILLLPDPKIKLVISIVALTITYMIWSAWLLICGWQDHRLERLSNTSAA